MLQTQV